MSQVNKIFSILFLCYLSIIQSSAQTINKIEYFFDTDPGFGNGIAVPLTPTTNIANFSFTASLSNITPGIHQLSVRSQDANGVWSITNRGFFFKDESINNLTNIVQIEYFFDTDPGFGNGIAVPVTPSTNVANFSFAASLSNITPGIHQLFVRSLDANGVWSITSRGFFFKDASTAMVSEIVKMEYFFDTDPGFGNGNPITITAASDIQNLNDVLNTSTLTNGSHTLFLRSLDNNGSWSITNAIDFEKVSSLNIVAYIQGYYAGGASMQNVLFNQGIEMNPSNHTDSVHIEFRESNSPYNIAYAYTAILNTDGNMLLNLPLSLFSNAYYIVLKHRNSIETWSANPVSLNTNPNYNFSTSASQAYGSNQVEVENGTWAIYNGDINQDGFVDIFDFLESDIDNQNFASGYRASDINGDGFVDVFDYLLGDSNSQLFISLSTP
ncbi:MAG: hypothetical protein R2831_02010 [Chitinophagaceae bacterium]